jgi:hypothetical protein
MATQSKDKVFISIDDERIELTGQALIEFEADRKRQRDRAEELDQAQATAKAAIFAKLGITAEEAQILLS